jgi:KipI family sensor histidine kinase inhibitor
VPRVLPYGDAALLVEPDDPRDVLALAAALRTDSGAVAAGVSEVVPAARTLLVRAESPARMATLRPALDRVLDQVLGHVRNAERLDPMTAAAPGWGTSIDIVELDVRYDGPDLAATAAEVGLDVDGLIRAHAGGRYVVAFCGFVPGFAYLTGLTPALHLSRLPEPRTQVPAGSVGIAGEFTGVYPRASPGGWRLLGTTDALLWDTDRRPPALLAPGAAVRFRPR